LTDLIWRREFNCGIEVMDDQHKLLVALINRLRAAIHSQNHVAIDSNLDDLIDYATSHLAFEHALMQDAGCQALAIEHEKTHGPFLRLLRDYRRRVFTDKSVADELNGVFSCWLLEHVQHHLAVSDQNDLTRLRDLVRDRREGGWLSCSLKCFFRGEHAKKLSEPVGQ
jgi:hemerythrin